MDVGLTQRELAAEAGCSAWTLARLEHGDVTPLYATADQIADALGVEVATLWPTLARDVEKRGRLLDTVIPITRAVKKRATNAHGMRMAYADPDGGTKVHHRHRPPICCGANWCRCVDLANPETYPIFGDPSLIEFAAGGVNG